MRKGDFEFIIASSPDREKVTCEIYYKNQILAELSQETGMPMLEIYAPTEGKWWTFSLLEFQQLLVMAKNHLIGNLSNED